MEKIQFTKIEGLGNDYVLVDCRTKMVKDPAELSRKVSNRHFGIGSDGLILLCKSDKADFKMRIFNSDGSEAEMCGNGIRGFARYILDKAISTKKQLKIETLAGVKTIDVIGDMLKVDMGEPILERAKIPMKGNPGKVINEPLKLSNKSVKITAVSMGNPHAVVFVETFNFSTEEMGKEIENHRNFPNRTNVEFVQVVNKKEINIQVWERGAGVTLACGTGASASLVACTLNKLTDRKVTAHLLGGDLQLEWNEKDNHVYMTGPANVAFEGTYNLK